MIFHDRRHAGQVLGERPRGLGEDAAWPSPGVDPIAFDAEVAIPMAAVTRSGHLTMPSLCQGIVVIAHSCRSSRSSPRTRSIARALNQAGFGTLLLDLLSEDEATDRRYVFDIDLLAGRLDAATDWLAGHDDARGRRIGYFGASTVAAAALSAAASSESRVSAVVSRGGRPDLVIPRLAAVRAPTLLIVGSRDDVVLDLNMKAAGHLRCPHRVAAVTGATHLFEEPDALERVARLTTDWFDEHLVANPSSVST
jgi:putative phosphoribosyl transferase